MALVRGCNSQRARGGGADPYGPFPDCAPISILLSDEALPRLHWPGLDEAFDGRERPQFDARIQMVAGSACLAMLPGINDLLTTLTDPWPRRDSGA